MVNHDHVRRCIGQSVICHTIHGDIRGTLFHCNRSHVFIKVSPYRAVSVDNLDVPEVVNSFGAESPSITQVWFGIGSIAVPLAAIAGITLIGLSATWW